MSTVGTDRREVTAPVSERQAPTFGRDRLSQAWLGIVALSQAGDALWLIGLAWTAVQLASPATAGLVVAAGTIPRGMVLLYGGAIADRYDARRTMIAANLVRVAVLASVIAASLVDRPSVGLLVVVAIGFGICDAVYEPSAATIGRQLVRPEDFPTYAGLSQTLVRLGAMGGNALGGLVVAWWGIGGSAAVNAVSFAISIGFVASLLRPRFPLDRARPEPATKAIGAGFRHLREEPLTRTLVLALSGLNLFVGPALGIGLALQARTDSGRAESLGLLLALVGFGGVLGSGALILRRPRRMAFVGFALLLLQGLAIIALGADGLLLTGVAAPVIGITAGAASVLLGASFTRVVDGAYLGRMVSIQRLGDDALMPGAMAVFGALAGATSVGTAFTAYGLAMVAVVLIPLSNRRLRELGG